MFRSAHSSIPAVLFRASRQWMVRPEQGQVQYHSHRYQYGRFMDVTADDPKIAHQQLMDHDDGIEESTKRGGKRSAPSQRIKKNDMDDMEDDSLVSEQELERSTRRPPAQRRSSEDEDSSISRMGFSEEPAKEPVCPCCYGAVHKQRHIVRQNLQPFFRSFSTKSSGSESVVSMIKAEHREAESDYRAYQSALDSREKEKIAHRLIKEISQHGAQEEMSIYPWMKQKDPSVADMVDHGIKEHGRLKDDLNRLDSLNIEDPEFDKTVQRVWHDLKHHIKEEEATILPKLEKMATADELAQLGQKFLQMKKIAPSRPHPMGPTGGGPGTKMANAGAAALDAARDAIQGRP